MGTILSQIHDGYEKVVAYASLAVTRQQSGWSTPHKECYSIVWGIQKFFKYLDEWRFTVITDHHSFCYLFSLKDPHGKLARWAVLLQSFDLKIKFKEGRCHADVDCLSHLQQ